MLVCYLPVGSEQAAKFYAQCAIDAKVAFVNALPVFIAGTKEWADKFTEAGVPIIGDDIKSQVGATITHRVLAKLFEDRGVILDRTMQLNVGGNMDFMNMLERERLESKKISKTQSVTSQLQHDLGKGNVHIGPSDYVQWLDDRKWAYVRLEGRAFGDVPLNLEYKLEVWDSPNSAGVIIDAVRAAKIALDRGNRQVFAVRVPVGPANIGQEFARRSVGDRGAGQHAVYGFELAGVHSMQYDGEFVGVGNTEQTGVSDFERLGEQGIGDRGEKLGRLSVPGCAVDDGTIRSKARGVDSAGFEGQPVINGLRDRSAQQLGCRQDDNENAQQ